MDFEKRYFKKMVQKEVQIHFSFMLVNNPTTIAQFSKWAGHIGQHFKLLPQKLSSSLIDDPVFVDLVSWKSSIH